MTAGADAGELPGPTPRTRPPLQVLTLAPGASDTERPARGGEERTIYVVEGRAELTLRGARRQLRPGEAVIIPGGASYTLRANGPRSTTVLRSSERAPRPPQGSAPGARPTRFH